MITSPAVDLVDLERLLAKATPGPYSYEVEDYHPDHVRGPDGKSIAHVIGDSAQTQDTAELIAAAVSALPALISELTELRASRSLMEEKDARIAALEDQLGSLITYGRWQCSDESLSHHPTLPSAVAAAQDVLGRSANMPRRAQSALATIKEKAT